MNDDLDDYVNAIVKSGVMSAETVAAYRSELEVSDEDDNGQTFAQLLVERKKLTPFQARVIYQGSSRSLVFGSYVVLDRLGAGGMGKVYRAEHRRMKRVVAIKMVPPEAMKSSETVRRFQREVEAAARLSHDNIVRAYDADESDGVHYLVMEYVEGRDLTPDPKNPLSVAAVVDCISQAATGLQYAHDRGLVHRDIKPSNLLLGRDGVVKILDMGMARFDETVDSDKTAAAGLTQTGQIMGTVDYMSPEQAEDARQADGRSDIYSLGCTLYCLLTHRPPFSGDTTIKVLLAHREQPIPRLKQQRPDIPDSLQSVFRKMVAKRAEDRYPTMQAVIEALQGVRVSDETALSSKPAAPVHYEEDSELGLADDEEENAGPALNRGPTPSAFTLHDRPTTNEQRQISVSCQCGQRFAADAMLAGKTVSCPKCDKPLQIPVPAGMEQTIEVTCKCGRRFAARRDLAGKVVACPGCAQNLHIPSPEKNVIEVRCRCGQRFAADVKFAGRNFKCTKCGKPVTMPFAAG